MVDRPPLPDPVAQKVRDIQREHDYPSKGEAIRHVFKEAGYDV